MVHFNLAQYPVAKTLALVTHLLESIIKANDKIPSKNVTWFHSRAVPNISIQAYLHRIIKFAPFENEALLGILVYFDRITELSVKRDSKFIINSLNIHRLLIASLAVSTKFSSDVFYPNSQYAKIGGIPLAELNQLEVEFLFLCGFDLFIKTEVLQKYGDKLIMLTSFNTKKNEAIRGTPIAKRSIQSIEDQQSEEDTNKYNRRKTYHMRIEQPFRNSRNTCISISSLSESPMLGSIRETQWTNSSNSLSPQIANL
ncbi:cyclin-domain-containing protein [Basidiobolus meristosporus CBS 931.73]|uniref:Cyclin-domain-containing protein n=1 Tax=Basidiobolus meristosporus CBS 931.73 TaxID=1314790 RepID=A0A1Y1YYQ7_9FUNG|nr:cyclin-domain-containing protein [Basidiobolus meristosporus CBS 931.73]|eukprot:ORY02705.1 cyclin-domain-containing protein [Basidiobolus meristosporus CBS 931.73]